MNQVSKMMTAAKQKSDFETVCKHYGCSDEEISEMKAIANENQAEARECFAYLAGQIRSKAST